jgi:hypothetical protein
MIPSALQVAVGMIAVAAIVTSALWSGYRSHCRFLQRARGPSSIALPSVGRQTPRDRLLIPHQGHHAGSSGQLPLLDIAALTVARVFATADQQHPRAHVHIGPVNPADFIQTQGRGNREADDPADGDDLAFVRLEQADQGLDFALGRTAVPRQPRTGRIRTGSAVPDPVR